MQGIHVGFKGLGEEARCVHEEHKTQRTMPREGASRFFVILCAFCAALSYSGVIRPRPELLASNERQQYAGGMMRAREAGAGAGAMGTSRRRILPPAVLRGATVVNYDHDVSCRKSL